MSKGQALEYQLLKWEPICGGVYQVNIHSFGYPLIVVTDLKCVKEVQISGQWCCNSSYP